MMPQNRLALETSLLTGLRIGDVLNLRTEKLRQHERARTEDGKYRRVYFPALLYDRLVANSGRIWVFEGRLDYRKHRTRAAVYNDLVRAAKLFRVDGKAAAGARNAAQCAEAVRGGRLPEALRHAAGAAPVKPQPRGGDSAVRHGGRFNRAEAERWENNRKRC